MLGSCFSIWAGAKEPRQPSSWIQHFELHVAQGLRVMESSRGSAVFKFKPREECPISRSESLCFQQDVVHAEQAVLSHVRCDSCGGNRVRLEIGHHGLTEKPRA